ncbi:plastid transcriptionally active 13 [Euphorbia peplus]|nr:plastid transcriptionally active 13 [Euphorbia peplus]
MKQGLLLQWSPCFRSISLPSISLPIHPSKHALPSITSAISAEQELTAKERRKLRNERREINSGYNWREQVEDRLINKPKKVVVTAGQQLNLDNLADLGPQWYALKVGRVNSHLTADLVARLLARDYPDFEFKVYAPSVKYKNKLKNGTFSIKSKPIFPGCVFLWCVLNREIHDFIRECNGVGGFVGSRVGNNKRQINRPKPVSTEDMEKIFQEAKEEQEKFDKEEQQDEEILNSANSAANDIAKPVGRSRKVTDPLAKGSPKKRTSKRPTAGSTVRVVSGNFAEFVGTVKKISRKTGKATVLFSLFGKETLVELDLSEIVMETSDTE